MAVGGEIMAKNELSVKDVASRAGVSYITALNYIKSGKILGIEKGGRWVVMENEMIRWETEGNRKNEIEGDDLHVANGN